jgi:polyhydroxyalkanoate synthesis regulator phasin
MAQTPNWQQLLEAGMQFTEMRRSQARRIAQDLVSQGQIARDQLASTVDELVDMSRRRTDDLTKLVRHEVQRQLGALGVATKADLDRLERKLAAAGKAAPGRTPKAAKAAAAVKASAAKSPAKKATAKKATAKKATAKKATAKKAPAKKAAASIVPTTGSATPPPGTPE